MKTRFESIVLYDVSGDEATGNAQPVGHCWYQIHAISSLWKNIFVAALSKLREQHFKMSLVLNILAALVIRGGYV